MIQLIENNKSVVLSVVILLTVSILLLGTYNSMSKDVTITMDNEVTAFKVTHDTVKELLYKNDIKIEDDDYINVDINNKLEDGMDIIIKRAVPITIYYGNEKIEIKSAADNVKELIGTLELQVDNDDRITPSLDEKVVENLEVKIVKVDEQIITTNEKMSYEIIEKSNEDMFKGEIITVQNGEEGIKEIKIRKVYENEELKSEMIVDSYIVKEPINKIVEKGTKSFINTVQGKIGFTKVINMVATAYDLSYSSTGKNPGDDHYGITASGTKARPGVVAVDPKVIPLGTKIYVEVIGSWPDYGVAMAEDTGGAIKGNKIDLFMENSTDAYNFGRRNVRIYILE